MDKLRNSAFKRCACYLPFICLVDKYCTCEKIKLLKRIKHMKKFQYFIIQFKHSARQPSPLWHFFRCQPSSLQPSLHHVFYIISENRPELHPYKRPMYKEIKCCSCLPSVSLTLPFHKQDHKHKHGWRWLWQRLNVSMPHFYCRGTIQVYFWSLGRKMPTIPNSEQTIK